MTHHDLTTYHVPPAAIKSLIGLGLNFVVQPTQSSGYDAIIKCVERFRRNLFTKTYFAGEVSEHDPTQLFIHSDWSPDKHSIPTELRARSNCFENSLTQAFRSKTVSSNLTPYQLYLLDFLIKNDNFIVFPADKNLGPCIIEREAYIKYALSLLAEKQYYRQLEKIEANKMMFNLRQEIRQFLTKYESLLSKNDITYIQRSIM